MSEEDRRRFEQHREQEWHQPGDTSTGHPRTTCKPDKCGQEPIPYPWDREGAPSIMYNFNDAFKYRIEASVEEIQQIAAILTAQRPGVPNGSSFAVTSDARHGQRHLWLSEVSYQTLIGMNIIPDMFQAKTSERI